MKSLLPPNYTVVYEVAKLPSRLRVAIKDGVITPMMRGDLTPGLKNAWGRFDFRQSAR